MDDDETDFCGGQDEDNRECDPLEVCTSTCQCWNGVEMVQENIRQFVGLTIEEQCKSLTGTAKDWPLLFAHILFFGALSLVVFTNHC